MVIMNTHSPDVGTSIDIRKLYWGNIKLTIHQLKRKDFLIWETDRNGQVSRNPDTEDKIIRKWTNSNETDDGNGGKLSKYGQTNLLMDNTFLYPGKANKAPKSMGRRR